MRHLIQLFILMIPVWGVGQGFVTPLSSISGDAVLTATDGRVIKGDLKSALFGPNGIMSLTILDQASGERVRFKAADVMKLRIKVDGLAKLEMIADKTSNLKKLLNADFDEVIDRKFSYYEQVMIPGKNRFVLTQLLNPGFDSKVRVFDKPIAKSGTTTVGGVEISGGEARAYYVIKGGQTYDVKKSDYARKGFNLLFGDCPQLVDLNPKPYFLNFAEHVLFYDRICK